MTTIYFEDVTCAVCSHQSQVRTMGSTNAFGSMDLDTRPPEMRRSTMDMWVYACPSCGHCATDLAEPGEGLAELVASEPYLAIRRDAAIPAKARDFLCQALIARVQGRLRAAAWATIHVAWVCDDEGVSDAAVRHRLEAVNLVDAADLAGTPVGHDAGGSAAIKTDLLRRGGSFAEARAVAQAAIDATPDEVIETVLQYQLRLIDTQDQSCRTIDDAFQAMQVS